MYECELGRLLPSSLAKTTLQDKLFSVVRRAIYGLTGRVGDSGKRQHEIASIWKVGHDRFPVLRADFLCEINNSHIVQQKKWGKESEHKWDLPFRSPSLVVDLLPKVLWELTPDGSEVAGFGEGELASKKDLLLWPRR